MTEDQARAEIKAAAVWPLTVDRIDIATPRMSVAYSRPGEISEWHSLDSLDGSVAAFKRFLAAIQAR